jgi:hypothetical protein
MATQAQPTPQTDASQQDQQQAQPVAPPSAPSSPPIFDMSKAQPVQGQGAPMFDMSKAQPLNQQTSPPQIAQISAIHQPTTMIGRLGRWAENVQEDLKYGSDITGVGAVLKAMGAHGLYMGSDSQVGELIASLPLGLLKAVKGASQVAPEAIGGPEGRTWEGLKNLGGGLLQAAQEPLSFIAPESSLLSKEGLLADAADIASKAPSVVGDAIKAVSTPVRESAAQPALQAGIRSTAAAVAKEAEVAAPTTPSIYKTVEEAADNVLAKSKGQYQTLDEATGGRVQRFTDRLENIRQSLNKLTGTEEDTAKEASLLKAQKETEDGMNEAFEYAKAQGVDPKLIEEATGNFKQSQALYDLDTAIQRSTSGKPLGVGNAKGLPETVDPKKLAPRMTALWKSGRLQQAIGEDNTADLMDYVGTAAKHQQSAIRNKVILKIALPLAGAGAVGAGVVHHKLAAASE